MITEDEIYQLIILNSDRLYSVTHVSDFDGIASAAILVHYTSMPIEHVIFGSQSKEEIENMNKELIRLNPSKSIILFTDISINDRVITVITDILRVLKQRGNRIAWIDHHPVSQKAIDAISEYCDFVVFGENQRYCGAELVYRIMSRKGAGAKKIAETAHLTDFNLRTERNKYLLDMLSSVVTFINYNKNNEENLRKLVGMVSNIDFENEYIKKKYFLYKKEAGKNRKILEGNAVAYKVGPYKIGVGYGKHLQTTSACAFIEEKLGTDMELFINLDGNRVNMRSREGVDCSILAKVLGGGGHKQASAAKIEEIAYLKNKNRLNELIESLIEKAKEVYVNYSIP